MVEKDKVSDLGQVAAALDRPVDNINRQGIFRRILSNDDVVFATLTIGDLVYDAARIDPIALEGINFARSADLETLPQFNAFADQLLAEPAQAFAGNISQLQGYVAERFVAQALREMGAEVEFPKTSNQAGYDLLVNGEPFQVKCLADKQGVNEHLEKYPDIPAFC
jgi:hypothetical protein